MFSTTLPDLVTAYVLLISSQKKSDTEPQVFSDLDKDVFRGLNMCLYGHKTKTF